MHRYYHSVLPNWSPWWLVMVWCAIIVIIGGSLYQGSPHHEPGLAMRCRIPTSRSVTRPSGAVDSIASFVR